MNRKKNKFSGRNPKLNQCIEALSSEPKGTLKMGKADITETLEEVIRISKDHVKEL